MKNVYSGAQQNYSFSYVGRHKRPMSPPNHPPIINSFNSFTFYFGFHYKLVFHTRVYIDNINVCCFVHTTI